MEVFIERGNLDSETCADDTEIWVMLLKPRNAQNFLQTAGNSARGQGQVHLQHLEGTALLKETYISDFQLPEL